MGILDAPSYSRAQADGRFARITKPNTIALLGDSITWYNGPGGTLDPATIVPYKSAQGYFTWANVALGGRLTLLRQAGVAGETSAQVLARVTDITNLSTLPGFCVVLAGTNDMLNDITSTTTITNLTAIYDALLAKGITVVACVMPHVWQNPATHANRLLAQAEVNNWIRDQAQRSGIIICDWAARWANDNGDGTPKPGFSPVGDGVHPTIVGAAALGKVLADTLRFYVGSKPDLVATNIDPTQLLLNGLMTGTTGILNTGATGQLATSWIAGRNAGSGTLTCAKASRTDGIAGAWQSLSLGSGGGTFIVYQDVVPAGLAAGQQYIAEAEFDSLVPTDIKKFTLTMASVNSGGAGGIALGEAAGATLVYPSEIPNGVMRTPVVTLGGSPTSIRISIDLIGTSGSVRVSRIRLRRVA